MERKRYRTQRAHNEAQSVNRIDTEPAHRARAHACCHDAEHRQKIGHDGFGAPLRDACAVLENHGDCLPIVPRALPLNASHPAWEWNPPIATSGAPALPIRKSVVSRTALRIQIANTPAGTSRSALGNRYSLRKNRIQPALKAISNPMPSIPEHDRAMETPKDPDSRR